MKKIITLALTVLCIFTALLVLASCGHEHSFDTKSWEKDADGHWNKCVVEGEECAETTEKEEHTFEEKSKTPASCEEEGVIVYACSVCGYEKEPEKIEALGHDKYERVVAPTCTEEGYTKVTCKREGCTYTRTKNRVAPQHDLDEEVIAPTCTESGVTIATCKAKGCDYSIEKDVTAALGHDKLENVIAPTCTEGGHTEVSCSRCDYTDVTDQTEATGHSYETNVVEPTCTEGGYSAQVCTACGDETDKADFTDALDHDYIEGTPVEPTCRFDGYTPVSCSRCDYTGTTDIVPLLGHEYYMGEDAKERVDYVIAEKPTCDVDGKRVYKCTRCGQFPIDGDKNIVAIPAIGHDEQEQIVPPTCTLKGVTIVTCTRCDFKENRNEVDANGHTYYKEADAELGVHYVVTTEPTCTEKGESSYYCQTEGCGLLATDDESGKVEIEALGHNWVVSVEPWCGNGGEFEYDCDRTCRGVECAETKTEKAAEEFKHSYSEDKVLIPATCVEYATYACAACEQEFVAYEGDEYGQPTGTHVYDTSINVVPSTCVDKGYTVYGCSAGNCGLTENRDYTDLVAHTLGQVSDYGTVSCDVCNKSYVDITAEKVSGSEGICICGQDPCICEGTITGWEGYAKPKEPMAVTANEVFTITEVVWTDGAHPLVIGGGLVVLNSAEGADFTVVIYTEDGTEALYTFNVSGTYAMIDLSDYEVVGKIDIVSTTDATVSFYNAI